MQQKPEPQPAQEGAQLISSTSSSHAGSTILKWWQGIRAFIFVIALIGWLVVLGLTIKGALEDKVLHESEVENIKNVAKIMFKLAGIDAITAPCFSGPECNGGHLSYEKPATNKTLGVSAPSAPTQV